MRPGVALVAALGPVVFVMATPDVRRQQQGEAAKAPCTAQQHRQFDFWLGEWRVANLQPADQNQLPSRSRITSILAGCAVLEEYDAPSGYSGKSLNFYDTPSRTWRQTWIDNQGAPLFLAGGLQDGRMVLQDTSSDGPSNRVTWTALATGQVRQHWQRSRDGGRTWETVFEGIYTHP